MNTSEESNVLSFFWWYNPPYDSTPLTLPQCANIPFGIGSNPNATVQPQPPYTLQMYPIGGQPRSIPAGDGQSIFQWPVGYPSGLNLLLQFVDANGRSGGVSPLTTITESANTNCLVDQDMSDLSITASTMNPLTCAQVTFTASGGQAPYTITIVKAADQAINITNVQDTAQWTNDMTAGSSFLYSVCDSANDCAPISALAFSQGGSNTSCITSRASGQPGQRPDEAGTGHGESKLLGGVIAASVIATLLVISIGFTFWWKRRKALSLNRRLSFTTNASSGSTYLPYGQPHSGEKHGRGVTSPYVGNVNDSAHSLQNLNGSPYKFRVVNPDVEQDDDGADAVSTANTYASNEPSWTAQSTAYQQQQDTSSAKRRSASFKSGVDYSLFGSRRFSQLSERDSPFADPPDTAHDSLEDMASINEAYLTR